MDALLLSPPAQACCKANRPLSQRVSPGRQRHETPIARNRHQMPIARHEARIPRRCVPGRGDRAAVGTVGPGRTLRAEAQWGPAASIVSRRWQDIRGPPAG